MYQFYEFCQFIGNTIDKCILLWYNSIKVKGGQPPPGDKPDKTIGRADLLHRPEKRER